VGSSKLSKDTLRERETDRLTAEAQRRAAAEEQVTRRAAVEIERDLAFLSYLVDLSPEN
jgi:hypothetical protein